MFLIKLEEEEKKRFTISRFFRKAYVFGRLSFTFDPSQIKDLLSHAFPFAIIFILMSLYSRMDGIMLKSLLDDDAVSAGIYAAGFRVYDAMNMVGFLFASLLLPMFANVLSM